MTELTFIEPLTLAGDRREENFDTINASDYHVRKRAKVDGQEQCT
jgi:hypothetical protein